VSHGPSVTIVTTESACQYVLMMMTMVIVACKACSSGSQGCST